MDPEWPFSQSCEMAAGERKTIFIGFFNLRLTGQ